MTLSGKAIALRIYIGERHRHGTVPLFEAIVLKAREMHMAGATVFRSPMGYGHSSLLHTANILQLSDNLPMVIDIVDTAEKISEFLPVLDGMMNGDGMVMMEDVNVVRYGAPEDNKKK
jgi:hypothetical protein